MTDWFEHKRIEEIDDFAEANLTREENDDYMGTFTDEYEDWSYVIGRWIEDKIAVLQTIQELVDDLPDTLNDGGVEE